MAENSKIEWTTHTFNPWRGCTKVSAECTNCYADTLSKRNPMTLGIWGPNGTRVVAAESAWKEPIKWDRLAKAAGERHRVFCASLADVFEDWDGKMAASDGDTMFNIGGKWTTNACPDERLLTMGDARRRLFDVIYKTPNLDWLLLTKRPENAARMMGPDGVGLYAHANGPVPCPQPNVWIGASVGERKSIWRIDALRNVAAKIRFLSCEPLLEDLGTLDLTGIHWVICGGESGHGSRPMHPQWARNLRDQCVKSGVAFHFKQWGEFSPIQLGNVKHIPVPSGVPMDEPAGMFKVGKKSAGRVLDGRTWDELPKVTA